MRTPPRRSRGVGLASSSRVLAPLPRNLNDPNGYYETLGVPSWASQQEIKKAFQKLARRYHPDGEEPDEEEFRYLSHIYEVLTNPQSKGEYDSVVEGFYISKWEEDLIRQAVRQGDLPEASLEDLEDTTPISPEEEYYDFYGSPVHRDLAQEWVRVFLEAYWARGVRTTVRVGVSEDHELHVIDHRESLGFVVFLLPTHLKPSYWIAVWLVGNFPLSTVGTL